MCLSLRSRIPLGRSAYHRRLSEKGRRDGLLGKIRVSITNFISGGIMQTIIGKHWHHLPEEEVLELLNETASR